MEKIIIMIAVGISVLYIIRRVWATISVAPKDACACGCSGCGAASSCDQNAETVERVESYEKNESGES